MFNFDTYEGFEPRTEGFYKNESRDRLEYWTPGVYGLVLTGQITFFTSTECVQFWQMVCEREKREKGKLCGHSQA